MVRTTYAELRKFYFKHLIHEDSQILLLRNAAYNGDTAKMISKYRSWLENDKDEELNRAAVNDAIKRLERMDKVGEKVVEFTVRSGEKVTLSALVERFEKERKNPRLKSFRKKKKTAGV